MRLAGPKAIHYSVDVHSMCVAVGVQGCTQSLPASRYTECLMNIEYSLHLIMFSHHLSFRLGPCTLDLPGARASLTLVERTKTPYLPSRVKPFLKMWAIWILRSYIDHCAHPLSD